MRWTIGPLIIRPIKAIPTLIALIVAWFAFGWKAALIVFLMSIDEASNE